MEIADTIVDYACRIVIKMIGTPCVRIFYMPFRSYITAVVRSPDEYSFSFSFKKPMKNTHHVFVISKTPNDILE